MGVSRKQNPPNLETAGTVKYRKTQIYRAKSGFAILIRSIPDCHVDSMALDTLIPLEISIYWFWWQERYFFCMQSSPLLLIPSIGWFLVRRFKYVQRDLGAYSTISMQS